MSELRSGGASAAPRRKGAGPRTAKLVTAGAFAAAVACAAFYLSAAAPIVSAYTSKIMCSAVFVSGRDPAGVLAEDLEAFPYATVEVDHESRSVVASLLGLGERRTAYRPGLGCTRIEDTGASLDALPPATTARGSGDPVDSGDTDDARGIGNGGNAHGAVNGEDSHNADNSGSGAASARRGELAAARARPWPDGDLGAEAFDLPGVDREKLDALVASAFEEPDPGLLLRTRAIVVVSGGRIVAERYAEGFTQETPLLGWSMTKSITNALVGILVGQGKLELAAPAPVPEWRGADDPRAAITLDQLMRMSSGLEFDEGYESPFDDAVVMLFKAHSTAAYAAAKPLALDPDTYWYYSSGTTNIVSRIVRDALGGTDRDYQAFPRRTLFDPIGMASAVLEPDPSGTFVGSSFSYATARDWARFGMLYLADGVWQDRRILPEGWVDYSRTATPTAPRGQYGAQFWMDAGHGPERAGRRWPQLPADAFYASGHEGQSVMIVPSRNAVIVRLGLSQSDEAWDTGGFAAEVLATLP